MASKVSQFKREGVRRTALRLKSTEEKDGPINYDSSKNITEILSGFHSIDEESDGKATDDNDTTKKKSSKSRLQNYYPSKVQPH